MARDTFKIGIKRYSLRGLAVLLPTMLTAYLLIWCYQFIDKNLGTYIQDLIKIHFKESLWAEPFIKYPWLNTLAGIVLAIVILFFIGAFLASFIGRKIWQGVERTLKGVPIVRSIYPHIKQFTDFFFSEKRTEYKAVVAIQYPRNGIWAIGLITGQGLKDLDSATGKHFINIFIPNSPSPITGYIVFVEPNEIIRLPITVQEALEFTVSAGIIIPPHQLIEEAKNTDKLKESSQSPKTPQSK